MNLNMLTSALLTIAHLFLPCLASAAIFFDIDTTVPLKCTFSSVHQNRIAVSGGRIAKAILPDGRIAVQMEEESGQVFVYAMGYIASEVTLSIVTDKGLVQDLEIKFKDQSSEVVILTDPAASEENNCEGQASQLQMISEVVEDILLGEVPKGYTFFECDHKKTTIGNNIVSKSLARFEGECDTIYLYKVFNCQRHEIFLYENQFTSPKTNWVYLTKNNLPATGETLLIIAESRDE